MAASVLAVMAHPDDAELWAGGTLAHHAHTGAQVTIAVPRHEPERDAEATAGAAILGADLRLLDHLTVPAVRDLLDQVRPEVVITHRIDDVHPDHRHAATTLLSALPEVVITTGCPRRVYTCDTYNSLTLIGPVHASVIIDITDTYDVKMRALQAHASQPITDHFGPMAEHLARLWGARIGSPHAEAFTPVPVLGRIPATTYL